MEIGLGVNFKVGFAVGFKVGFLVGFAVGFVVGLAVGLGVEVGRMYTVGTGVATEGSRSPGPQDVVKSQAGKD